jgi:cytochrome c oxidase subunit 4
MVLTVLLVSMEMIEEPPLVRVFSALGFFWVMIMFGMTLTDYLYR